MTLYNTLQLQFIVLLVDLGTDDREDERGMETMISAKTAHEKSLSAQEKRAKEILDNAERMAEIELKKIYERIEKACQKGGMVIAYDFGVDDNLSDAEVIAMDIIKSKLIEQEYSVKLYPKSNNCLSINWENSND